MNRQSYPRKAKCKNILCKAEYIKKSINHLACSPSCAIAIVVAKREKAERAQTKARLIALKTRSDWLKEAQIEFNKYIRERDRDLPCISCGRYHTGAYDAGHYRSIGAAPQLRFDEDNCHKQCVPCNQYKSGNAIEYRRALLGRIGKDSVERLESSEGVLRLTIDELKAIKAHYKAKTRELINRGEKIYA